MIDIAYIDIVISACTEQLTRPISTIFKGKLFICTYFEWMINYDRPRLSVLIERIFEPY